MRTFLLFVLMASLSAITGYGEDSKTYETITHGTVQGVDTLILNDFPPYISKQLYFSFETDVTGYFDYITLGQTNGYIRVDNENITLYGNKTDGSFGVRQTIAHGLTIGGKLKVSVHIIGEEITTATMNADVEVKTETGRYNTRLNSWYYTHGGKVTATCNMTGNNATLKATCYDFSSPVWMMGDSYFGMSAVRWPYYMRKMGYFNYYFEGLGGGTSWDMYNELVKSLKYGTPKYLVWCLGMNNPDTDTITPNKSWLNHVEKVKALCEEKNIILILSTIPNVPKRINTAKNVVVKESGYRYIDFAKAVGAEETGSSWYDGMLHADGIHPVALGAQALANQVLVDFPEIMTLGKNIEPGDVNGDGVIDITDVNCTINIMLGNDSITGFKGKADVNGDGLVDITDVNLIVNMMLGK